MNILSEDQIKCLYVLYLHIVVPWRTHHSFIICQHQTWWECLTSGSWFIVRHKERRQREWNGKHKQLHTMLEKDMLLWKSFSSLENIFSVESGIKRHFSNTELYFFTHFPTNETTTLKRRNSGHFSFTWSATSFLIVKLCILLLLIGKHTNVKCGALFLWWHHLWQYRNLRWPLEAEVATVEHIQYKSLHHMMSLLIIHYDTDYKEATHTALW